MTTTYHFESLEQIEKFKRTLNLEEIKRNREKQVKEFHGKLNGIRLALVNEINDFSNKSKTNTKNKRMERLVTKHLNELLRLQKEFYVKMQNSDSKLELMAILNKKMNYFRNNLNKNILISYIFNSRFMDTPFDKPLIEFCFIFIFIFVFILFNCDFPFRIFDLTLFY